MGEFEEHIDEVRKYQEQQMELAKQHDEINKAQIESFIDGLSGDQLKTLGKMITLAVTDGDIGQQFLGIISGCFMWKHGRSWNGDASPLADPALSLAFKMQQAAGQPMTDMDRIEASASDAYAAKLKEYNLVPSQENEGTFNCGNCNMFYMTLEDRMIKEPGIKGCSGCQQKAMFG